jgi:hypothetical protein
MPIRPKRLKTEKAPLINRLKLAKRTIKQDLLPQDHPMPELLHLEALDTLRVLRTKAVLLEAVERFNHTSHDALLPGIPINITHNHRCKSLPMEPTTIEMRHLGIMTVEEVPRPLLEDPILRLLLDTTIREDTSTVLHHQWSDLPLVAATNQV